MLDINNIFILKMACIYKEELDTCSILVCKIEILINDYCKTLSPNQNIFLNLTAKCLKIVITCRPIITQCNILLGSNQLNFSNEAGLKSIKKYLQQACDDCENFIESRLVLIYDNLSAAYDNLITIEGQNKQVQLIGLGYSKLPSFPSFPFKDGKPPENLQPFAGHVLCFNQLTDIGQIKAGSIRSVQNSIFEIIGTDHHTIIDSFPSESNIIKDANIIFYNRLTKDTSKPINYLVPKNCFFFELDISEKYLPVRYISHPKNIVNVSNAFTDLAQIEGYLISKNGKISFDEWELIHDSFYKKDIKTSLTSLVESSLNLEMMFGKKLIQSVPRKLTLINTIRFIDNCFPKDDSSRKEYQTFCSRKECALSFILMCYGNGKISGMSINLTEKIFAIIEIFWQHFFPEEMSVFLQRNAQIPPEVANNIIFTGQELAMYIKYKKDTQNSLKNETFFSSLNSLEQLRELITLPVIEKLETVMKRTY